MKGHLRRGLSAGALAALAALSGPSALALILVEQGEPRAVIVTGQEAAPCVPAAHRLVLYSPIIIGG